ncbi:MAG: hypothetical protein AAF335_03670 [Bacteroidota bacterium]
MIEKNNNTRSENSHNFFSWRALFVSCAMALAPMTVQAGWISSVLKTVGMGMLMMTVDPPQADAALTPAPTVISPKSLIATGINPYVVSRVDGEAGAFSYSFQTSPTSPRNLWFARCAHFSCANESMPMAMQIASNVGRVHALELTQAKLPVMLYVNNQSKELIRAQCTTIDCLGGGIIHFSTLASSLSSENGYISFELDDNDVLVATHNNGSYVQTIRCADASCTGPTTVNVTAPDGNEHHALQLTSAPLPVIIYSDVSNNLIVRRCADFFCVFLSLPNILANNAIFHAFKIDEDNFPVITYFHTQAEELRMIRCRDASCSRNNIQVVIYPALFSTMQRSTLILDEGSRPVIAYLTSINVVRVAWCYNKYCTRITTSSIDNISPMPLWAATLQYVGNLEVAIAAMAKILPNPYSPCRWHVRGMRISNCAIRSCRLLDFRYRACW